MSKKIIIIGGVAAGLNAATRLRRLSEDFEITVFEKNQDIAVSNCALTKLISGELGSEDKIILSTAEKIKERYRLDLRLNTEVLSIEPASKVINYFDPKTRQDEIMQYDYLIVATGSRQERKLDLEAIFPQVFYFKNIDDLRKLQAFISKAQPQKAVILGASYTGVELATALKTKGLEVSLIEEEEQVLRNLDPDIAAFAEEKLLQKGIDLYLGRKLAGAENGDLILSDASRISADLLILATGITPNTELLAKAKIKLTANATVACDLEQRTTDKSIYAIGDIVDRAGKVYALSSLSAQDARIAADSIYAHSQGERYRAERRKNLATIITQVFDLNLAITGKSEKDLQKENKFYTKDYDVTIVHLESHAVYLASSRTMAMKLIYDQDEKILGAQIAGYAGVDKRIDVLATAIYFGAYLSDLAKLDLAYAPDYSTPKDAINLLGHVALNKQRGLSQVMRVEELRYLADSKKFTVLDLREEEEQMIGKIKDAKSFPLSQIRENLKDLDPKESYVLACVAGLRAYIGERILRSHGFKVQNLAGGYDSYKLADNIDKLYSKEESAQSDLAETVDVKNLQTVHLDLCGLSCPGPIVELAKAMKAQEEGVALEIFASDPGFASDVKSWCDNTGNSLLDLGEEDGKIKAIIAKGKVKVKARSQQASNEKTMIVFSGDLDKAIASFIIATGAAAMGNQVNMFFTFWGLSVLRKQDPPKQKKNFLSKLFALMLPKGSKKLKLSQMNFAGAGAKMIRMIMKKQGVSSLEALIQDAKDAGVKFVACQMSMDVMGISKEELIDGVEVGGVATMLNDSDRSNMNLFI